MFTSRDRQCPTPAAGPDFAHGSIARRSRHSSRRRPDADPGRPAGGRPADQLRHELCRYRDGRADQHGRSWRDCGGFLGLGGGVSVRPRRADGRLRHGVAARRGGAQSSGRRVRSAIALAVAGAWRSAVLCDALDRLADGLDRGRYRGCGGRAGLSRCDQLGRSGLVPDDGAAFFLRGHGLHPADHVCRRARHSLQYSAELCPDVRQLRISGSGCGRRRLGHGRRVLAAADRPGAVDRLAAALLVLSTVFPLQPPQSNRDRRAAEAGSADRNHGLSRGRHVRRFGAPDRLTRCSGGRGASGRDELCRSDVHGAGGPGRGHHRPGRQRHGAR